MVPETKTAMNAASEGLLPASLTCNISGREGRQSFTITTEASAASSTGSARPAANANIIDVSIALAQFADNASSVDYSIGVASCTTSINGRHC
eukprot:CAMPEP_0172298880 /NCGR_PEP_ID=MMETSP1058-20130122/1328_1 /TAXON_ID=83371 /ORGANISM="Detonula confervacea, Strain CCMP 353" /LENGTH=92 /DNA_ID=CAMNT_0013008175 /DNA_START=236 /DNA_END=514 /DNA_ORIENTATION=-